MIILRTPKINTACTRSYHSGGMLAQELSKLITVKNIIGL